MNAKWSPRTWGLLAHFVVVGVVGAYAFLKERSEMGCTRWTATSRQCSDEDSVYVAGTAPSRADDRTTIKRKLESILSYHEKAGVWKRCFLLAAVMAYLSHVIHTGSAGAGWSFAVQHLVFFAVLYFVINFVNYHHFRVLKKHGTALLKLL